jgi:hypothetical protein
MERPNLKLGRKTNISKRAAALTTSFTFKKSKIKASNVKSIVPSLLSKTADAFFIFTQMFVLR